MDMNKMLDIILFILIIVFGMLLACAILVGFTFLIKYIGKNIIHEPVIKEDEQQS